LILSETGNCTVFPLRILQQDRGAFAGGQLIALMPWRGDCQEQNCEFLASYGSPKSIRAHEANGLSSQHRGRHSRPARGSVRLRDTSRHGFKDLAPAARKKWQITSRCVSPVGDICGEGVVWHPEHHPVYWTNVNRFLIHRMNLEDESTRTWIFHEPVAAFSHPCEENLPPRPRNASE
jgi:hypothetical protein